MMLKNNVEVQNVFTKYIHYRNLSCIYLVPNLNHKLNTNYLVLFKEHWDKK